LSANDGSASTRLIVARNLSARTRFSPEAFSTGTNVLTGVGGFSVNYFRAGFSVFCRKNMKLPDQDSNLD
jgi:hypothetical protein